METRHATGPTVAPNRSRRLPLVALIVVAVVAVSGLLAFAQSARGQDGGDGDASAANVPSHGAPGEMAGMGHDGGTGHEVGGIVVAAAPTDGVLTIVIPPGTDAAMKQSGSASYHMPSVMRLKVGDTIEIRNDDTAPHMILYTFLLPGQTDRRTFTDVGSEAYSSGCAANAAEFPDFTTIFIFDR
jgi:hypothetical protein